MAQRFRLTFNVVRELDIDQNWPDGDAPPNPSADDVAGLIEACGGSLKVLDEWHLAEDEGIVVDEVAS